MVFVENRARVGHRQSIFAGLVPGQIHHPLEIGTDHSVLRRGSGHLFEPLEFAERLLQGLFGHLGRVDLASQLIDLRVFVDTLAKLFADVIQLLTQHVLTLGLAHLALDLLADLAFDLDRIGGPAQLISRAAQPRDHVQLL